MTLGETSDEVKVGDDSDARDYPRPISPREREWMVWILPPDRPGYRHYHDLVSGMVVIGKGRRGEGEIILGAEGSTPDVSSPLAPVFAYGAIETKAGTISITMREISDGQISIEIVSHQSEEIPSEFKTDEWWRKRKLDSPPRDRRQPSNKSSSVPETTPPKEKGRS